MPNLPAPMRNHSISKTLLRDTIDISRQVGHTKKAVEIDYIVDRKPGAKRKFTIDGHDLRIGQIVTNLIENARSFVAKDTGKITVKLMRTRDALRDLCRG